MVREKGCRSRRVDHTKTVIVGILGSIVIATGEDPEVVPVAVEPLDRVRPRPVDRITGHFVGSPAELLEHRRLLGPAGVADMVTDPLNAPVRGHITPALRMQVKRTVVHGGQCDEPTPGHPFMIGIWMGRLVGPTVEALIAHGDQLAWRQSLDIAAHLLDPGDQRVTRCVGRAARLVRQLPRHDCRVGVVSQPGVPVPPADHMPYPGLIAVPDVTAPEKVVVLGREPGGVLRYPAEITPVVRQHDHEAEPELAGPEHGVVQVRETVLVIGEGRRLEHDPVGRGTVEETPAAHHPQPHRPGVREHAVGHVATLVVEVVVVRATEAEPAAVDGEAATARGAATTCGAATAHGDERAGAVPTGCRSGRGRSSLRIRSIMVHGDLLLSGRGHGR